MASDRQRRSGSPADADVVAALLHRHGRTFASEAGIRLRRATPAPLFRLLCLSLLLSARIRADAAVEAARALADAGWTTAPKMAGSTWERRTKVLNQSGYARYDESTSRYLGDTAELLLDRYGGDLRRLRAEADGDVKAAKQLLTAFKGMGDVGADVFLREAQGVWSEYVPFVDDRARDSAKALDLPSSPDALRSLVDDDRTFTELVAALVRAQLDDDHEAVLDEAAD